MGIYKRDQLKSISICKPVPRETKNKMGEWPKNDRDWRLFLDILCLSCPASIISIVPLILGSISYQGENCNQYFCDEYYKITLSTYGIGSGILGGFCGWLAGAFGLLAYGTGTTNTYIFLHFVTVWINYIKTSHKYTENEMIFSIPLLWVKKTESSRNWIEYFSVLLDSWLGYLQYVMILLGYLFFPAIFYSIFIQGLIIIRHILM